MKRIHSSNFHYAVLLTGLIIFGFLFVHFRSNVLMAQIIAICGGLYYFTWGMIHHILEKDLHIKIVLEYLVIALIGVFLLISLAVRS